MNKATILISACLLGQPVRYNGQAKNLFHPQIERWRRQQRLISICPEISAGFATPRPAAEIASMQDGEHVLDGTAQVIDCSGVTLTDKFIQGAYQALDVAIANGCRFALLTDGSPSCGSQRIYGGAFNGITHGGTGVTTALLKRHGIQVFSEDHIDRLYQLIG
jgi:uncharacterized protein YbbK (DUF523 family)